MIKKHPILVAALALAIFVVCAPARAQTAADFQNKQQAALISAYLDSLKRLLVSLEELLSQQTLSAYADTSSTVPVAPTVSITPASPNANSNALSWNSVSGATNYAVYRMISGGSWAALFGGSYLTSTNVNDGPLGAGTYYYHVNACNTSGCSADSNVVSGAIPFTQPALSVTVSGTSASLSWTAVAGTSGFYRGFRYPAPSGSLTTIFDNYSNTTYTDQNVPAGSWTYYMVVCNSSNVCSVSNMVTVTIATASDTQAPSVPTNVAVDPNYYYSSSQLRVTWNVSTDNVGVTGYKVYRDGSYIASVPATTYPLSYGDSGLSPSSNHSYTISAYDAAGNISAQSASASGLTYPAATQITVSNSSTPPVNISWANYFGGISEYKLYRRTPPSTGSWVLLLSGTLATSYSDSGVSSGASYEYKILACNASGCSGDNSSMSYGTVSVGSSTAVADTTPPSTPAGLGGNTTSSSQINIYWNASTDNVGVAGYKIYRNGSYLASVSGTYYSDTGLSAGTTYSYAVAAYDAAGNVSPQSASFSTVTFFSSSTTTSATSTTSSSGYGACVVRDNYTSLPGYFAPDLGTGYAKASKSGVTTISGLQSSCSQTDFSNLLQSYCTINHNSIQQEVATYDSNGNYQSTSCGAFGCNYILCPTTSNTSTSTSAVSSTIPSAPSSLFAAAKSNGSGVDLNWTDNSTNESQFKIFREPQGGYWTTIDSVSQNSVSYSDLNLTAGGYYYQVAACNSYGCSAGSNVAYVSVGSAIGLSTSTAITTTATNATSTASLSGSVLDTSGNPVAGAGVHIFSPDYGLSFGASSDSKGLWSLSLPQGNYYIEIFAPSGRLDLIKPPATNIPVPYSGSLVLRFAAANKTISGRATFQSGVAVTDAEVSAYSSANNQWTSAFTASDGSYLLQVSGGAWQVGMRPRNPSSAKWFWNGPFPSVTFLSDQSLETRVVSLTAQSAGATLIVKTSAEDGSPIPAGVVVDTVSAKTQNPSPTAPPLFKATDSSGSATFNLAVGTYYIRGSLSGTSGLINPEEKSISLSSGDSATITLVFRKLQSVNSLNVRGLTKLDDGTPVSAFIWAWSENGLSLSAKSGADGGFSLTLAYPDKWHLGAGTELNGAPYKSSVIFIDLSGGANPANLEISLAKIIGAPLAPAVSVNQSAATDIVAQVQDGAKVVLPANSAPAGGTVSVDVRPTIEAPSGPAAKVVSTVYDVKLKDTSGNEITNISNDAEITIPYNDDDLKAQGLSPDSVTPSYFDEKTGSWVKVDNYVLDKARHVFVVKANHFTRFALIAAASIVPPDAPTAVQAEANGSGGITLSWSNPTHNFDHAKIYRSTSKAALGIVVKDSALGPLFKDNDGLVDGTVYYYTVRSVDAVGNESANFDQVAVAAVGSSPQRTAAGFMRNLKFGSRGDDVSLLQKILANENVYPEKLVTGFFGSLTKAAVVGFQEKYREEILAPLGLGRGTGFVGPATIVKLNKLVQQ